MGGFNFDFSGLNPLITGLANRSLAAMDYKLNRLPQESAMQDAAYQNFMRNEAQKRKIALGGYEEDVRGRQASQALQQQMLREAQGEKNKAEMARRYAESGPTRDAANYGTAIGGPGAESYQAMVQRMQRMAAAGVPVANYTGITDLVNASSGASAAATQAAGANARSGSCPPGYAPSAFGGCQQTGAGWGARG